MPTANINSWQSSATYPGVNSLTQTNPYADEGNAVNLYGVDTYQARHSVAFSWRVTGGGATVIFTPSTGATSATDYIKFTLRDMSGNEAYATGFVAASATKALTVTTSSLEPTDDWTVLYSTSNTDGATKVAFEFEIGTAQIVGNSSAAVSYSLT